MNSEWLRYFVALAETKNFHQAAMRLHVTPQAVSKAIAGLEAQLGVTLVGRDHRVKGLTSEGEILLEEARGVLKGLENARRRINACKDETPQGPVSLAGDGLWHHYLLPPLLAELGARFPGVCPQLYEMLPNDVEHWVAAGEVDIGLLLRPPVRADLNWEAGLKSPYVIVGRPQPQRSWQAWGYIVPRYFRREFIEPLDGWPEALYPRRIAAKVELLETAIALCEAGVGAAFLPELAVKERLRHGVLAVLAEAPCAFSDDLYIIWRKGVVPTPAARETLKALGAL